MNNNEQGHTKALAGIARTPPFTPDILLCRTVRVRGMLVPNFTEKVDPVRSSK
jgi:hypothetical protein